MARNVCKAFAPKKLSSSGCDDALKLTKDETRAQDPREEMAVGKWGSGLAEARTSAPSRSSCRRLLKVLLVVVCKAKTLLLRAFLTVHKLPTTKWRMCGKVAPGCCRMPHATCQLPAASCGLHGSQLIPSAFALLLLLLPPLLIFVFALVLFPSLFFTLSFLFSSV